MNDPSVHDVLAGSLDRHGRAVGTPEGDLGDVLRRVDRRRARRRSTAVIGSTLAVAAGAAGIMLVAAPANAPAPGDGDADATAAAGSWGCAGPIQGDGIVDYYALCEALPYRATPTALVEETAPPATLVPLSTFPPIPSSEHSVAAGQSVSMIADLYGVEPTMLADFNGWSEGIDHVLMVGDVVRVPDPFTAATVAAVSSTVAITNPPVCESGTGDAIVSVPCPTQTMAAVASVPVSACLSFSADSNVAPMTMPCGGPVPTFFRCTGRLGADSTYTYYRSCDEVRWDSIPTTPFVLATTVPPTIPPPVTTAPETISPTEQTYTVVAGDSLSSIAELYGISLQILANYNAWAEGVEHPLFPGDVVKIPPGSRIP